MRTWNFFCRPILAAVGRWPRWSSRWGRGPGPGLAGWRRAGDLRLQVLEVLEDQEDPGLGSLVVDLYWPVGLSRWCSHQAEETKCKNYLAIMSRSCILPEGLWPRWDTVGKQSQRQKLWVWLKKSASSKSSTSSLLYSCHRVVFNCNYQKRFEGTQDASPLPLLTRAVERCAFIATQEEEGFASRCVLHSPIVRLCNTSYHIVTHCACNTDPLWSTTVGNGYYPSLKFTWAPTRILPARRLIVRLFLSVYQSCKSEMTTPLADRRHGPFFMPWTRRYQSDFVWQSILWVSW